MPGRREGGQDICVLPMSFGEFARVNNGIAMPACSLWNTIASEDNFNEFKIALIQVETKLKQLLSSYLQFGGFPRVVAEIKAQREMTDTTHEMLLAVMASEVEKQRRSAATLRMILHALYNAMPNPISLNRIAASQNIPSATTVKEYLEILHSSFVVFPVAALDISKGIAFPRKDRKYYFVDPAFPNAIRTSFSLPGLTEPCLAESAAAVALIRHFATQWARWGHVETLYYWRSSSNREVDFVIRENGHFHGLEVKYQNTVSGWDELSIVRGIGRGILVTRDAFEFAPVPRIPLWAFLTLQI